MSKTYRRKNVTQDYDWLLLDWNSYYYDIGKVPQLDPCSKEARRRLARYHSDSAKISDHMGPKVFRVISTHRPDRHEAKANLHCWIRNGMDPEGDWNTYMSRTYRRSIFFEYWD